MRMSPYHPNRTIKLTSLGSALRSRGRYFANPQFAADQAIAPSRSDKCKHFWSEPIGFRHLPGLAPKALAARFCGGDTGADPLLNQLPLEFGDAGDDRCHHAAVRCR